MKNHVTKFNLVVASLILFGASMTFGRTIFQTKHADSAALEAFTTTVEAEKSVTASPVLIEGKPVHLEIDSIDLDVAVVDGAYDQKTKAWTLSKDSAHYAVMTPLANNQAGNTFIYGHNRKEVFARLAQVKKGDVLSLTTETGFIFRYEFVSSLETDPYDDSLFQYEGSPILTVQTCSGLWFQNRQLFTFKFLDVKQELTDAF